MSTYQCGLLSICAEWYVGWSSSYCVKNTWANSYCDAYALSKHSTICEIIDQALCTNAGILGCEYDT